MTNLKSISEAELWSELGTRGTLSFSNKLDHVRSVIDKYTESEFEEYLPASGIKKEGEPEKTLADFDNDDIEQHLLSEWKRKGGSDVYGFDLFEFLKEEYDDSGEDELPSLLMEDEIKKEHVLKVWSKYTSAEFESRLP